jgi:aryl carrier-like protein
MTALQEEFAMAVGVLLSKAKEMGYAVTFGEAYRTPEQAAWNAAHGSGIKNSLHTRRLAVDLNFFKSGELISDSAQLADIGAWWKRQGPMYCWGGDFPRPDGNHFSISPDGVTA